MQITMTLDEIQERCADWEAFCCETDICIYACAEGFGSTTKTLTEEQAVKYGLIRGTQ